jgi:hypothetical protein
MNPDSLKRLLIEFLRSGDSGIEIDGICVFDRNGAKERLCELIPATIEVYKISALPISAVAAAPHIHFDGWSGHFARRVSEEFGFGWVVAKNFRDNDSLEIPVSIGRHLHVNRPTESLERLGREKETPRARDAYVKYVKAIAQAGGKSIPVDILIEFHGHRTHEAIEIATTGISVDLANTMQSVYLTASKEMPQAPELRIEPLHRLHYSANSAKQQGVMQDSIAAQSLHIELPREIRRTKADRERTWNLLHPMIRCLMDSRN